MFFIVSILRYLLPKRFTGTHDLIDHVGNRLVTGTRRVLLVSVGVVVCGIWTVAVQTRKRRAGKINGRLRRKRLIVITGCDSGLGLSMAYWATKLGYKVVAGCLDPNGEGANFLKKNLGDDANSCQVIALDVTKSESLDSFRDKCSSIIQKGNSVGERLELWAVVLNAGIGAFGEFFWQTPTLHKQIMDVNFWGSVNLTKEFKSLLLQHKSRLIVISSDCADYPLPGMAIYSASKAALETWATSLRREVSKYGVSVISFQPGSFPMTSRLFARQNVYYEEMKKQMSHEELKFYGEYFHDYNQNVIRLFSKKPSAIGLQTDKALKKYFVSLLEGDIRYTPVLIYSNPFIKIFHFLLRNSPTKYADFLVPKLLKFPKWSPPSPATPVIQNGNGNHS